MRDIQKRIVAAIIFTTLLLNIAPIDYFDVYAAETWKIDNKTNDVIIYSSTLKGTDLISIFQAKVDIQSNEFRYGYDIPDNHDTNWRNYGIEVNPNDEYSFEFGTSDTVDIFAAPKYDWDRGDGTKLTIKKAYTTEIEPTDPRQPATVDVMTDKNIGKFNTESEFDVAVKSMITASWSNSEGRGWVNSESIDVLLALSYETKNELGETVKYYSVTVTVSEGENWLATEQATVFEDVYWSVNQYTISFNTDGGTAISPIKQDYGTNITPPTTPTKDGYTFIGWDKELPTTMPAENIVVTANWAVATKNVSFDPNGGVWLDGTRGIKTEKFNFDYNLDEYIAPKRSGYDFGGWKKQETAIPGADESYEAIWNIGKTVTFKDGDTALDYNYAVGETITPPTLAERIGHTFVGWDLVEQNGVGDGKTDAVTAMGNESVTYVAIWIPKKYTVTFLYENGDLFESMEYDYGFEIIPPSGSAKEGHTFVGWDLNVNGNFDGIADTVSPTMGAGNLEYREIFEINQYTITFDTKSGSELSPITQNYGTTITQPAYPTKVGYVFEGWDIPIPQIMPARDYTITAIWKVNSYTITFDTDGGSEISPIVYEYGEVVSVSSIPSKIGYTFAGWDKEIPETMPAEDLTLKAKWMINQYTITFDTDGGSAISPITQNYGDAVAAPDDPTKSYHTFSGWDKKIPVTMPAENVTIKALWNANNYTITFDTDGGSQIDPITQAYGTEITKPSNPTKDGYTFIGWDKEIPSTMPAESTTITAKWEEITRKVSFDPDGGTWVDGSTSICIKVFKFNDAADSYIAPKRSGYDFAGWKKHETSILGADESYVAIWNIGKTVTFKDGDSVIEQHYAIEETVLIPSVSDKTGYTFVGWDLVGQDGISDGLKDTVISIMGNESITYVAIWEKNKYTVTFYHENGDIYESHTKYYGELFSISNDPSKTGHTFIGWDLIVNDICDKEPDTVSWIMGAQNLEYKEIFKINQYTITFNTDGGSKIEPITQNYDSEIKPPFYPTKVGCEFVCWDINVPQKMPAKDLTITAIWNINSYTITFDTDGGSCVSPIVLKYGDVVLIPNEPSKIGHTFAGWDIEIPETMPAENLTIKAKWSKNTYTIFFDVVGDVEIDSITQEYGTAITQPTDPVKIGHTFIGWDQDIPVTMPAESITITAKWRINTYTVTWIPNGGTWEDEVVVDSNGNFVQTYSYGDEIVPPKSLTKSGYNLSWGTVASTMCDDNLEYTAQWAEGNTVTFIDGAITTTTAYANGADIGKPADPIKIGYTFVGWDLIIADGKGDGEKDEVAEIMGNSNISYVALWSINSYTVNWTIEGEDYVKTEVVYGENTIVPSSPVKTGYTFGGWTVPESMPAEDITLNAVWIINQYTINFITNGGTEIPAITKNYGETIVAPEDPVKTGYAFARWDVEIPSTMPAENRTISARWTINTYKVIWNPNGGIWSDGTVGSKIASYEYGEAIQIPDGLTKAGFNLVWGEIDATMEASDVEYEAMWIEGDTVTFNDGINMITKPYAIGEPIDQPDNPSKIGHKFIGWDANGDNKKDSVIKTMGEESIVYVALWEKIQYTVTFYYENGDIYEAHTKYYSESFSITNEPSKTGYTFVGWDLKKDGKYDGIADAVIPTMGAEDLEYREIFKINQYTITFDTNGGSTIEPITLNYGTTVTPPEHPTKVGCEFDGWDIIIPQTMPARNYTITAIWKTNSYTITFDTDGGSEISPIVYKYGEVVSISSVPSKIGYTFAGWDNEIPETMPAESITIRALWTVNNYTITFDTDGGSQIDPITQAYGTEITKTSDPIKEGYTFIGWDKEIPSTMPAENMLITAKWKEATKIVSFDPNGGKWSDGSTLSKTEVLKFSDDVHSCPAPTKSAYDFGGWQKQESAIPGSDESYVANWILGKTVTFKDGDVVYKNNYALGENVTAPVLGEKVGYTFVGWDLVGINGVGDGFKDQVVSVMGNESLVYVAIWQANEYTVYFYDENDELIEAVTAKYGAPFGISITPTKTGYTFVGWDLKKDGKYDGIADEVSTTMGAENLEYREIFRINQYTITFNTNGGSEIAPITQNYGTTITPPEQPTKIGCSFDGWDIAIPQTMPDMDIIITANWKTNSYKITFDTDGGSELDPITIQYGEIVSVSIVPSKIGHTFAGWDQEIPTTMPAEDLIIKALWTANDYTIIFDTDGGSKIDPLTQAFGTDIPKPCDPTKEGYVFIGWDNVIPSTMPAENITITAIWEIATKTVSFAPNGGTWNDGSESIRIEVLKLNDVIDSYIAPKRSGYDFAGWQKKDSAISGADESYVAVWNIGNTVTFKDGDSVIEQHYAIEETVLIPSVSDKIGHTFVGWDLIEENGVGDGSRDTVISIMENESIAYVAIWEKNKYTVTFYHENGDLYEAHTKYYGESFSISNEPSKIGYTFIGWDLIVDDICDKEPDTVSWIMGAQNLEYKEIFKINQYTITFNTNGGSEIAPITQNFDSDIAPPSHPTKIGCEFVGWDINVPQKMPAKDITLTAIWNANSYTIVFDTDGGNYIAPIVQKYGESVLLPNEPSKTGHTFAGWDLIIADGKGDGEKDEIVDTMGDSNISYVALWSINSYEVNWTVDGQDYVKTAVVYGESIVVPAAPVKIGYTFGGWTVPDTMPAEDITLNAVWIINQYTISFITNGGTEIPKITKNYGEIIVTPEDPVKTGYTFVGWDIEIPTTMPAENITISAQWTINSYKVIWNPNGGKWSDGTTGGKIVSYKYGEAIQIPDGLTKAGFNLFWDEIDTTMGANDVEYVAKWSEGDTVTFNDGIKTVVRPYAVGETIDLPENPSKIGYRFIGWDANGDSKKDSVVKTMGEESIVYVALWEKMQYTVTFYYENGDLYEAHTNYYGESFSITNEPTLTGHTFVGWDLKVDGKYDNEPDEVSWIIGAENLEYREIFKINQYTITFDTVGGSVIEPITLNYGTTITPPEHPTKVGCEFDGWDIIIPQTMPAVDYTITARWMTNSYTITFDTDGGSEISPIVYKYGEVVSISSVPSKIGYTFAGWDNEIPETMPAENLILKAKWTINQYTIVFDTDGGSAITPIAQDYGTPVTVPNNPTKEYHTFAGWDKEIPATMPAENITIKALWNVNNYTITFDTDGGSQIDPITQAYGTEITKPSNPTKDGYTFIGWDKEIPSTMPAESTTITAKWKEAVKIISFDPNGGVWSDGSSEVRIEKLNLDYNADRYVAPTRSGYDFGGWKKKDTAVSGANESYEAFWILGKTVTFKDGDVVYEGNYAYGETITLPILVEKVGHTFVGWDLVGINGVGDGFKDQVVSVMGNESFVYVAIWQANEYTVYFYDENDELIEAVTAKYGAPFGISITPTKTGHTFVGWDLKKDGKYDAIADAVSPTMGAENLEYREIFAIGQYTITFDSAGGSAVDPITQSYGTDIVVPADPTKEGYVFVGWDQGVPLTMPALNITLTARWEKAKYSISWDMNADGVIDDYDIVTTVEHGNIPALPEAEVPVKGSTEKFSYVFTNSWLPAIKPAEGDATYTAQYDAVPRKYTVKFLNYDGTPLQTSEVEYGSTPVYSGSTPIKIDDKQYDYTFAGWSPTVESVSKDAIYTATYTESIKKYTVVWKNWDGSVLDTDYAVEHGAFPKYDGKTPTKSATEAVNYIFEGWEPQISGLTGDVTYTATFAEKVKTYSITWLAEDGSVIDVTVVEYGKIPACAAPMKPSTAEYSYTFDGWIPAPIAVTKDATYTASYTATKNKYTVTWNVDGEKTSESYEYGVLPAFKGSTDKAADGCTVYSFTGWNKAVSEVVGNVEYIATYSTATVHISTEFVYERNHNNIHSKKHECCKLVVETVACTDALNDGNHKCDFCGADNIGTHIGGKASCKSLAKCDECGSTYGSYDENNHESNQIGYSDITKTTHDEFFACCNAIKADNSAHNYVDKNCICGAKKIVTVVIMNGESVWETIESGDDAEVSVSDMPVPTPTPGYVFSGWYTEDGVRVDSETNLTDDMVLHAGYFSGDVDGDGTIEKEDVDKLTRYIVGQDVETVEDEKAFDINGDGNVTVVDSILLLLHISGKRPMTP